MEDQTLYREIKKKKLILERRKPYALSIQAMIREINTCEWISSSLQLDGSSLSPQQIQGILRGEVTMNATLDEHAMIHRFQEAIRRASEYAALGYQLNEATVLQLYNILTGLGIHHYRKGNPVLIALSYNPPHPQEIPEQMGILFHWLATDQKETNPIRKASLFHHRFVEIYPFEHYNELMARFLFYFLLMKEDLPPFTISLNETEYNGLLAKFFRNEDIQPFCQLMERSLYNKMEVLIQLTNID
jgi:Fic family protein